MRGSYSRGRVVSPMKPVGHLSRFDPAMVLVGVFNDGENKFSRREEQAMEKKKVKSPRNV